MFIYHFNRMIRSRILWLFFAIIIAIAFLSVDSCVGGGMPTNASNDSAGTIGEEQISYNEYELASRFVQNATRDLSPVATETQIWAHIAAMHTAKELGISVSANEIREMIAQTPAFQSGGAFDMNLYMELITRQLGISPAAYERLLNDQITLTKLMTAVSAGAPVSKMAIEDETAARSDIFTIRYATVSNKYATVEVKPSEKDLEAYYNANSNNFALPDRVMVRFVSLPVTNFTAGIEIADVDIEDYYESDPSQYTRQGTNGVEQLTLDEAREQIREELALIEAQYIAVTNLAAFMDQVATNDLETFTWRAEARGFKPTDTPLFALDARYIRGVESSAREEFLNSAADLDASRADSLYGIARGKRNVYLMRIVTNEVAHIPAFESLKSTLSPLVIAEKRAEMFDTFAKEIKGKLETATAGKSFDAACKELALNVSTSITFSASTIASEIFDNARAIVPEVIRVKEGKLSEPIDIFNGAAIAYVEKRTSGSPFEVASTRVTVSEQLGNMQNGAFFTEWMTWNLLNKGFTSKRLDSLLSEDYEEDDFEE